MQQDWCLSNEIALLRAQGQNPDIAIPFTLVNYLELVDWGVIKSVH